MQPDHFNVLLVRPETTSAHNLYRGAATLLCSALQRLGYPARIVENEFVFDATNIVVGAHQLEPRVADTLPVDTIIYNTEMIVGRPLFLPALIPFVQRFETWDYSQRNVRAWAEQGICARVRWLQPGYVPECTTIDPATPTDIDAVFYGHVTPRRRAVLDKLADLDVRVYVLQDMYGAQRDRYIARARLILNIHADPQSVFEIARMSHALSNRRALVSEVDTHDEIDAELREGIAFATAEDIPQLCRSLLDDEPRRLALAERGFETYRRRDFTASVGKLLAAREAQVAGEASFRTA
jgi:hypothetical protein